MAAKRETRIVFLIPASTAWENQRDQLAQKASWAGDLPPHVKVFWYLGRQNEAEEVIGDVLYLNCAEGYDYILAKTIHAIRWLNENLDFDVVIRTNVSTYFDLRRTLEVAEAFQNQDIKVGGFLDQTYFGVGKSKMKLRFITGTGIVMSREAVKLLGSSDLDSVFGVPDDVAISAFFLSQNFQLTSIRRGNLSVTRLFVPSWQIRLKASDDPYLASSRFSLVHGYFNSQEKKGKAREYFRIQLNEFKNFRWGGKYMMTYLRNLTHILKLNLLRNITRNG